MLHGAGQELKLQLPANRAGASTVYSAGGVEWFWTLEKASGEVPGVVRSTTFHTKLPPSFGLESWNILELKNDLRFWWNLIVSDNGLGSV